jgi:hypothetical protein
MRRRPQGLNEQLAGSHALQAIEFASVDHHHGVTAMQSDRLRPIAMGHPHELTESGLGVLKAPMPAQGLCGRYCHV